MARKRVWNGAQDLRRMCVAIADLRPDPENARKHGEKNREAIRSSLAQFGQQKPVVWHDFGNGERIVIAGNGTLLEAIELGWTHIAASEFAGAHEDARGYALADNRSGELAEWDFEVLQRQIQALDVDDRAVDWTVSDLGWSTADVRRVSREVDAGRARELAGAAGSTASPRTAERQGDRAPERVSRGERWKLGRHVLVCGDAREADTWRLLLGDRVPDALVTDPPYGVAVGDRNASVSQGRFTLPTVGVTDRLEGDGSPQEAIALLDGVLHHALARVRPGGPVWVFSAPGPDGLDMALALRGRKVLRQILAWVKGSFVPGRSDFHYRHESLLYGWVPGAAHTRPVDRGLSSVLEFPVDRGGPSYHPTMKPVDLVEYLLLHTTAEQQLVVDPFAGAGSTLLACERSERRAAVIELQPYYCDAIVERWEQMTGETATCTQGARAASKKE